jgi:uncharacterized protein (TIGR02996 family)
MTEEAFLRALRERPADDTTRLVYADWLEELGDDASAAQACFLRLDHELTGLPNGDQRRKRLEAELRRLAADVAPAWAAVVSRARIEKCSREGQAEPARRTRRSRRKRAGTGGAKGGVEVEFKCPMRWDQLQPTDAASVRHCASCQRSVYYCATAEDAIGHAIVGDCVAVDARVTLRDGDLNLVVLGMPMRPARPEWDRPAEGSDGISSSSTGTGSAPRRGS